MSSVVSFASLLFHWFSLPLTCFLICVSVDENHWWREASVAVILIFGSCQGAAFQSADQQQLKWKRRPSEGGRWLAACSGGRWCSRGERSGRGWSGWSWQGRVGQTNKFERKNEENGSFLGLKYSEEDSDYVARLSNSSVEKKSEARGAVATFLPPTLLPTPASLNNHSAWDLLLMSIW